jgi:AAHS family 4-hydroxybenzoate transporter-like MFS transporter
MHAASSTVASDLDARELSPYQLRIVIVCGLIAMLDGFDTQAIAFLAPEIALQWGVPFAGFGAVFGAGLVGGMLGAMLFGLAGDRFGRKPCLLASMLLFGVTSLATVMAHSIDGLTAYRFITGIGLGGAIPIIVALTSEYAPARMRATLITSMFCGFPLGAAIGGLASAKIITAYGWKAVFVVGGVLPLAVIPLVMWLLPESIAFLLNRGKLIDANRILDRIGVPHATGPVLAAVKAAPGASQVKMLFIDGRAFGTLLLWMTFFFSLALTYFLINWIPSVSRQAGVAAEGAIIGVAMLNLGSIFGCLLLGRVIDRVGPFKVIGPAYALAALAIAALGYADSAAMLGAIAFTVGFLALGAQMCVVALAAVFYEPQYRATGVGGAMSVGRLGAVAGPVIGGVLVGLGMSSRDIFFFTAATSVLAAVSVWAMGRLTRPKVVRAPAGPP